MDACIFILTINMAMPVYASDLTTEISELDINDKVCVMQIESNNWMQVHWSNGNVGHTGFIRNTGVSKPAQPTEPTPYESQEHLAPPPPPAPAPQKQGGQFAPDSHLVMICSPASGSPYAVSLTMNDAKHIDVISNSGTARSYPIYDMNNNENNHVLYIAAKRPDQDRTLYFAFDYSGKGNDVSAIRVKAPNGYDARDKCAMKGVQ